MMDIYEERKFPSYIFKFSNRRNELIGLSLGSGLLFIGISYIFVRLNAVWSPSYLKALVLMSIIFMGRFYIEALFGTIADLIINEKGVSRRLFGHIVIILPWDEIYRIHIRKGWEEIGSRNPGWNVRVFANKRAKSNFLFPKRCTSFNDKTEREKLADILNFYAKIYGIPLLGSYAFAENKSDRKAKPIPKIDFWYTPEELERIAKKSPNDISKAKEITVVYKTPSQIVPPKSLPSSQPTWFYCNRDIEHGPVDEATLCHLITSGKITLTDTLKKQNERFWTPVAERLDELNLKIEE